MTDAAETIELNPRLDRTMLRRVYNAHGRIHIAGILNSGAERLYRSLHDETTYNLVVNSGGKYFDLPPSELAAMDEAKRAALADAAAQGAKRGFQLFYDNHRLTDEGEPYADPNHYLAQAVAFLNSPDFLSFVRTVTGETRIAFADAQATRYGPGHFLTLHDDGIAGKNRLAAYVLNMTPQWRADWGGNLLFVNERGHISEGYVPTFNALNILKVPQAHLVSHVAPFANAHRYSIAGWFRAR